jgi:hypothetical protein
MKNLSFPLMIVIFCFMVLFSCKKDNPALCSTAWATELQNELTAISTAISVYSMDPSDANCNALKAAYQDYIDALRPYGNCPTLTGQSRTDWQNALNEAEADIDTIC